MENPQNSSPQDSKDDAVKAFLVHLLVFIVVNGVLLIVPVFYDGTVDFSFSDRGPLFYGSVVWTVGLAIHGLVVLVSWLSKRSSS